MSGASAPRVVLHIDMDAFYAQVRDSRLLRLRKACTRGWQTAP